MASELTRVYRGAGGAEADIKRELSTLGANASKEQKIAAYKNITNLLTSRLHALETQYKNGMGIAAQQGGFITPEAQTVLDKILGSRNSYGSSPNPYGSSGYYQNDSSSGYTPYPYGGT